VRKRIFCGCMGPARVGNQGRTGAENALRTRFQRFVPAGRRFIPDGKVSAEVVRAVREWAVTPQFRTVGWLSASSYQLPAARSPLPAGTDGREAREAGAGSGKLHFALRAFRSTAPARTRGLARSQTRDSDPGAHPSPRAVSFERLQPRSELFIRSFGCAVWWSISTRCVRHEMSRVVPHRLEARTRSQRCGENWKR
jgi:hypothetical protein